MCFAQRLLTILSIYLLSKFDDLACYKDLPKFVDNLPIMTTLGVPDRGVN